MSAVIEARGVSFAYGHAPGGEPILRDLDFSTEDGEFVCVLGPSGCGKTTVLRLLAGFDRAGAGEVLVRGQPVIGPGVDRGVVFQGDDSLFTWLTALDNVLFGPRVRGLSAKETHDIAAHFMNVVGLANHMQKYPGELSGGMRQRIQIARVLANSPEIMLMDEPFGALDAQTRAELQDELARIWAETRKSVVFITHDIMEAILLADRVAVMKSGPGSRIREFVEIDLPRPRQRSHPRFGQLYDHINGLIIEEVRAARGLGGPRQ